MKIKLLYYILPLFFLLACKNENTSEEAVLSRQFSLKDLVETNLKLYESNAILHPILDSIIDLTVKCPDYKNEQFGFFLTSYSDSINRLLISIENTTKLYEFNYNRCNGVFYYKGYQFALIGISTSILKDLGKTIKIFFVNPAKLRKMYNEKSEFFYSSWNYVYKNNKFFCLSYNRCGNYWPKNSK